MYSQRSYLLFRTMSNCWEHELQQCLDTGVDFPVAEFIKLHSEVPQPTIRRRHAQLRATLMKRLQKRAALGIQAATVASLKTPESQAAKGSSGGKKNTAESQANKGKKNTAESQARQGFFWRQEEHRGVPSGQGFVWRQEEHHGVLGGQGFVWRQEEYRGVPR